MASAQTTPKHNAPEASPAPALAPGDEAAPGTPGSGESICPQCGGTGRIDGHDCPECSGSGKLIVGIGGA